MDKMRMESSDLTKRNIEAIGALFPNCITETRGADGSIRHAVNFDMLRQMLTDEVIAGDEAYEFTWVGKKAAMVEASRPIRKTLRPCKEESKDWDTTENLYIEGDNLDVLKLLQESYLGKVKMIYIDPPYNTGHDFIYRDSFARSKAEEEQQMGMFDEETDEQLFENTESNGRFHSDWCSMMYPRLILARNMLADDGAIFISIDDHEYDNLRKICDEVFGAANFIDTIIWQKRYSPQNAVQYFSESHDYIVVYAKNRVIWRPKLLARTEEMNERYKNIDNDPRGPWKAGDSTAQAGHGTKAQFYVLTAPNGKQHYLPSGACWRYTEEAMKKLIADNRVWFGSDGNNVPAIKRFLSEAKQGVTCQTIWPYEEVGHSQEGKKEIKALFPEGIPFDTPKPTRLLKRIVDITTENDSIVLDFFSGSATLAHSVFLSNKETNGHRQFILVQIPENTEIDSEAYRIGFHNICDIGKERIRRAGEKIKSEAGLLAQDLDIGFRVLKLDETNMKDVYYSAAEYSQERLANMESNIKEDRTDLDLLYGCLLEWALPLSLPYSVETIDGCTVHTYGSADPTEAHVPLKACFDENVPESVVRAIADRKPLRVVFRDSSFASSPERINVEEIFKLLSPSTNVRVL